MERIKKKHGTLQLWLERHDVDILCLQETKVSKEDLELNARKLGALDEREGGVGYDTFWTYPQMGSKQRKGLNGVATFVKKGKTVKATSQVFHDQSLDSEGRCLMTDHGEFVIFNVYAPFSGCEYARLAYKMKMLKRLHIAMHNQRSLGKRVILAGDLNVTLRGVDTTRDARCIYIEHILEDQSRDLLKRGNGLFRLQKEHIERVHHTVDKLRQVWPEVKNLLNTSLEIEQSTDLKYFNSAVNSDGKRVRLGKRSFNKPIFNFQLGGHFVPSEDGTEMYEARPKDALSLEELREAISNLKYNFANGGAPGKDSSISSEEWNLIGKI